jgi:ComF family protein
MRCGDPLASWRTLSRELAWCPRCRRFPSPLSCSRSAGEYNGALRHIVHVFKYEGRRSLAGSLARLMREAGSEVLTGSDCVVPVPLHPWRQIRRGFNQANDLAQGLDMPVVRALWRSRYTVSQTGLTAASRRRNVRDAFRLSPLLTQRTLDTHIRNRIVVLVDDVRTTGATLEACARVLKHAGATEVRALTAAYARGPGPQQRRPGLDAVGRASTA